MDKIAAMAVGTVTFVQVAEARFGFVGSVLDGVASQLLRPVSELTAFSVRADAMDHVVLAKGTLNFRLSRGSRFFVFGGLGAVDWHIWFLGLSVGVWLAGRGGGLEGVPGGRNHVNGDGIIIIEPSYGPLLVKEIIGKF